MQISEVSVKVCRVVHPCQSVNARCSLLLDIKEVVSLMGSSFLSEVDDTSILRTGALHCYHYPLSSLPASRLLLPRSGLERSDFVLWHQTDMLGQADDVYP